MYQDLALCDNLDIVHNMFLGRELKKGFRLDESAMETRAAEVLASLSVRTVRSIRQHVASLSGGQRQTVAIARAVLWNSKLVILDEPTAALGVAQTEQVLQLVRRLADAGLAVVLVSHNMNDVFEVADSINVLYLGQTAAQVRTKDTSRTEVIELITSGSAGMAPGAVAPKISPDAPERATTVATATTSDATTPRTGAPPHEHVHGSSGIPHVAVAAGRLGRAAHVRRGGRQLRQQGARRRHGLAAGHPRAGRAHARVRHPQARARSRRR